MADPLPAERSIEIESICGWVLTSFSIEHMIANASPIEAAPVPRAVVRAWRAYQPLAVAASPRWITKTRSVGMVFPETGPVTTAANITGCIDTLGTVDSLPHDIAVAPRVGLVGLTKAIRRAIIQAAHGSTVGSNPPHVAHAESNTRGQPQLVSDGPLHHRRF